MENFTPVSALIGGLLIGLAAVLLLWGQGRIAGISGIASHLLDTQGYERNWRLVFLCGLVGGAGVWFVLSGKLPEPRATLPGWLLALAGLLVGYGSAMGNGCTSGHGVCGLGRLSLRSLAAVMVFLSVAIATTFVVRHLLGVPT